MALLHNTVIQSAMLGRRMAGLEAPLPLSGLARSERKNWFSGDHTPSKRSGVIDGSNHPVTWSMARDAGGMAAHGTIIGSGGINPNLRLVLEALATIAGSGGITALGGLIVNMVATISGSGGVTSAQISAYLNLLATIGGSGGITATASGLGQMVAAISGTGSVTSSTATGVGSMSATLRGYGDLTPEGIRDSVWSALLSQYQAAGSAGKALSTAGSGGVDLTALSAAVWTYAMESGVTAEQFMRIMGAAMAGKVSGAGTGTETFKGLNGTTNRIVSTVDANGNRTNVTVNGS